jgi:hypothetical protein
MTLFAKFVNKICLPFSHHRAGSFSGILFEPLAQPMALERLLHVFLTAKANPRSPGSASRQCFSGLRDQQANLKMAHFLTAGDPPYIAAGIFDTHDTSRRILGIDLRQILNSKER